MKTPGIHKICFEGTRNLYTQIDAVRVQVKMHDEAKHEKKIESTLKDKDFEDVKQKISDVSSQLFLIGGKLTESEEHINAFEQVQSEYDSNANYLAFTVIFVVTLSGVIEILLFRNNVVGDKKFK